MMPEIEAARIEGATLERQRIRSILELPEAKGNENVAIAMAMNSVLSVDEVRAFLRDLPSEEITSRGGRSCESPIGLAVMETPRLAGDALTADEVAARVNDGAAQ